MDPHHQMKRGFTRAPTRGSASGLRQAPGAWNPSFWYGIAKAPPLLGVPGATPPGGFQGIALSARLPPRRASRHNDMRPMTPTIASIFIPLMRWVDPERAHELSLSALRLGLAGRERGTHDAVLAVDALGRRLANPIGLAAGFDKDASAVAALMRLGFGFVQTGTANPSPQAGKPRTRLFRLR